MFNSQRFSIKAIILQLCVFLLICVFIGFVKPVQVVHSAPSSTYTVNSTGDQADADLDDSVCATSGGLCTLRAAIQQANVVASGKDTINFHSSIFGIVPDTELPALTNSNGAIIYSDHFLLLNGISVSGDGLTLASNNNKVMGLTITGFNNGVVVIGDYNIIGTDGNGTNDANEKNSIYSNDDGTGYGIELAGDHNVVAGNYIGTTNGSDIAANTTGIFVAGDDNRVGTDGNGTSDTEERNVISGNDAHGIDIEGDNTVVAGNYIGLKKNGTEAQPNDSDGVAIDVLAANTRVGTDSDGNGDTAEMNIISGNGDNGVRNQGDNTTIAGNYIGTNAAGSAAVPNGGYGVTVSYSSYDAVIGTNGDGTRDAIEGNTISGNTSGGVKVTNNNQGTWIAGNKIGTNPAGTAALANTGDGVYAEGVGTDLVIGTNGDGTADANERNIISGNGQNGVHLGSSLSGAKVGGNYIGTNASGTAALANAGDGVYAEGSGTDLMIGTNGDGTSDANERNIISGNGQNGVHLSSGLTYAVVAGNYIGTNVSGTAAIGNGNNGVLLDGGANSNIIGSDYDGTADTQERNLISGNTQSGVRVEGDGTDSNKIVGNYLGTDVSGNSALGNNIGVRVDDQAYYTIIGAITYADLGNVISGNTSGSVGMAISINGQRE